MFAFKLEYKIKLEARGFKANFRKEFVYSFQSYNIFFKTEGFKFLLKSQAS